MCYRDLSISSDLSRAGNGIGRWYHLSVVSERESHAATPASPRWKSALSLVMGLVPALLLLSVGVWEMRAAGSAGADIPGDRAWRFAALNLRARHQRGEPIVFAPRWIDPVGRLHLGALMDVTTAAHMDDARYGTIWEVSIRGASAPGSRGRKVEFERWYRGVRVRKLSRKPVRVVTDFVARFDYSDKNLVQISGETAQPVRVGLNEVGFAPRRCIRVAPRPDTSVRLTFKGVNLGTELVGYVGLANIFTRRDIVESGRLQVFIDDNEVASTEVGNTDGWIRFAAETRPRRADVSFVATAVGAGARQRLICIAAEARE